MVVRVQTPEQWDAVDELLQAYAASLPISIDTSRLDAMWLAHGSEGCVGLREFDRDSGEIKRLFVRPDARGKGHARALMQAAIAEARVRGYRRVLLDTLDSMHGAKALYAKLAFRPIERYHDRGTDTTEYFELRFT